MIIPEFESRLAPYMVGLIEQKRALGYKYETQTMYLEKFDAFCVERTPDDDTVTREMLDIWSIKKPYEHPGTVRGRVTVIIHLAEFICTLGREAYVFPKKTLPKEPQYIPHIYSTDELQSLFRQIDCCHYSAEAPNRHLILI